jgi:hypothetical protein
MIFGKQELPRIERATGLRLVQETLDLIYSLQSPDQYEKFVDDLNKVVLIYEDSLSKGGRIDQQYISEWDLVCKRIGMWSSYTSMLKPKRQGWFGKKEIPFPAKMMLSQVLSPEAPIMKANILKF